MNIRLVAYLLSGLLAVAPAVGAETSPSPDDGLTPVDSGDFDSLYTAETGALAGFDRVFVAPPEVAFRDHWLRDQNRYAPQRLRERDVERIRERMAELMRETVTEEFTANGWSVAEAPGPGVLVVRPNIVDLDVIAPDVRDANRSFTFSESAGAMTLDLELADGASGRVLLRAEDRRRDPRRGFLEWRTEVYNTAVARRMMKGWARDLRATLEQDRDLAASG